ncbi:MAG TPA: response regulator [Verrucomicrobiae bacterium]|nr:response regulator [Verrucomicrobiae bacterium]
MNDTPLKPIRRVLVVDDDHSVRESLRRLLQSEHFDVATAANVCEALEAMHAARIDLVVLDVNLGGESGWDLFRHIAEREAFVPVVVVTGEWGQHEEAVRFGAEALLEKPIDVPVFLETLRELLGRRGTQPRQRLPGRLDYCRYIPRHYEPVLRLLQERQDAPFEIEATTDICAVPGHR